MNKVTVGSDVTRGAVGADWDKTQEGPEARVCYALQFRGKSEERRRGECPRTL